MLPESIADLFSCPGDTAGALHSLVGLDFICDSDFLELIKVWERHGLVSVQSHHESNLQMQ